LEVGRVPEFRISDFGAMRKARRGEPDVKSQVSHVLQILGPGQPWNQKEKPREF
jgi:hypothetical protein